MITVLERAQAVANSLHDMETQIKALELPADHPVTTAVADHHDRLNKLRRAFGVPLVRVEDETSFGLRSSNTGNKGGGGDDDGGN